MPARHANKGSDRLSATSIGDLQRVLWRMRLIRLNHGRLSATTASHCTSCRRSSMSAPKLTRKAACYDILRRLYLPKSQNVAVRVQLEAWKLGLRTSCLLCATMMATLTVSISNPRGSFGQELASLFLSAVAYYSPVVFHKIIVFIGDNFTRSPSTKC